MPAANSRAPRLRATRGPPTCRERARAMAADSSSRIKAMQRNWAFKVSVVASRGVRAVLRRMRRVPCS